MPEKRSDRGDLLYTAELWWTQNVFWSLTNARSLSLSLSYVSVSMHACVRACVCARARACVGDVRSCWHFCSVVLLFGLFGLLFNRRDGIQSEEIP